MKFLDCDCSFQTRTAFATLCVIGAMAGDAFASNGLQPTASPIYRSQCGETTDHNEADLCEQRRMAQAALDAVWWARAQTIVGVLGFFGVAASLGFTAWAAQAAANAANAAQASVDIAERTAERQLRAYISVTPTLLGGLWLGGRIRIECSIKNHGQTPASDIHHNLGIGVFPNPLPPGFKFPPPSIDVTNSVSVYPDSDTKVWASIFESTTQEQVDQVAANQARLYCWGTTHYQDIFGKKRAVQLCAFVAGKEVIDAEKAFNEGRRSDLPAWNWGYFKGHGHDLPAEDNDSQSSGNT